MRMQKYNNLLKFRPFFMVIFQKKSDQGRFLTNMLEIKFEQLLNKKTVAQLTPSAINLPEINSKTVRNESIYPLL